MAAGSPHKLTRSLLKLQRLHNRFDDRANERGREQGGTLVVAQTCAGEVVSVCTCA